MDSIYCNNVIIEFECDLRAEKLTAHKIQWFLFNRTKIKYLSIFGHRTPSVFSLKELKVSQRVYGLRRLSFTFVLSYSALNVKKIGFIVCGSFSRFETVKCDSRMSLVSVSSVFTHMRRNWYIFVIGI